MAWFRNLRVTTKFNLIVAVVILVSFAAAAFIGYQRQKELVIRGALDSARLIAQQIIETRDYMSSVVRNEPEQNYNLVPQVVATSVASRITRGTHFYVRQVSLRYRNPANRPDEFEAEQLKQLATLASGPSHALTTIDGREHLRFLLPMVAEKSCLQCHGRFEDAPSFVRQRFPRGHYSYNYRLGEVIGAVSVTIPLENLYREIGLNLTLDLLYRGVIFVAILIIISLLIHRTILRRITTLANQMSEVTETGRFSHRLPTREQDEIGSLIGTFNDMMEELEFRSLQQKESEERYRSLIEMAQSPIISFLADGKIIISNKKAEELMGLPRNILLGESFFSFFEDGDLLQKAIASHLTNGPIGTTTTHTLRNVKGRVIQVEIALSTSPSDRIHLFTAIIRPLPSGH
ncbi:MAG TPA: DUF3365 domain-containing protein [Geobacterales bacterium]|nr:DUF3365 domain-containing protein [Geobacterales bacterium]